MFEVAEIGQSISKQEYKTRIPGLRTDLLRAQQDIGEHNFPVLIIVSGVDGGGKGDIINLLNEWMDPRYIRTHAFAEPTEEESNRPHFWRYWMGLPKKGETGIFVGSWYSDPISRWMSKQSSHAEFDRDLSHINTLERELTDDGMLIIKCWIHMGKKDQEKRFAELRKDPKTRWRVTGRDIKHLKLYDEFVALANRVIRETSTGHAPWLIVEGTDLKYSSLTVGEHILARIKNHISRLSAKKKATPSITPVIKENEKSILQALEMDDRKLDKRTYVDRLEKYQGRLNRLARKARKKGVSTILLFEGWDAGGKGGAIRRIIHALDARQYRVIPVAAPTDEEKAHHYLWRFWRHLPRSGNFTIYDRSWYGRVLVERVEKFARYDEWFRAYAEINDFEAGFSEHGIVIVKYWLHITRDEQEKRFREREKISYKQHKITEEDYRNREKWDDYERAVNDMVARTSTEYAPWHLIEANDKRYARIKVIQTCCKALEKGLRSA
ncbi:MAG: polyphosphate:AMP phosphotransferase [Gammaproteobacteria bacterium]|nr:polyphosphate:AMP phosphotransferase [Gammaproteobacteria bacterium]